MKKLAVSVLLILSFTSLPAVAAQPKIVRDITRGMRHFESQLCKQVQSSKCRQVKRTKPAAKPVKVQQAKKKIEKKKDEKPAEQQATVKIEPVVAKPEAKVEKKIVVEKKVVTPVLKPKQVAIMAQPEPGDLEKTEKSEVKKAEDAQQPLSKAEPLQKTASLAAVRKPTALPPPLGTAEMEKCLMDLQATGASFAPVTVEDSEDGCQVVNPVKINSIVIGKRTTRFPEQPILACAYALKFSQWMAANVTLEDGRRITSLWTGPGYQCRGRNGDVTSKLSEHAFGNAVDIERFKLSDGSTIVVTDALKPGSAGFTLLQKLRGSACVTFTTVVGPGANTAHGNHLHFDLEPRKSGYRICQ